MDINTFAVRLDEVMFELGRLFVKKGPAEFLNSKISPGQFILMLMLKKQNEAKMTDIAKFLGVSTPAATGMVERLVDAGYLVRLFEPADRRIIKIRLSSKGLALVEKVVAQRRKIIIDTFGKLSEEDRKNYLEILEKVRNIFKDKIEYGKNNK
ncbi:MAG: MarR family transcriptional regulator [Candidatus Omnitrophica bacterium]|nr:MarR family transcriptional regulator [Candidatus Omnitrophota bacterium]